MAHRNTTPVYELLIIKDDLPLDLTDLSSISVQLADGDTVIYEFAPTFNVTNEEAGRVSVTFSEYDTNVFENEYREYDVFFTLTIGIYTYRFVLATKTQPTFTKREMCGAGDVIITAYYPGEGNVSVSVLGGYALGNVQISALGGYAWGNVQIFARRENAFGSVAAIGQREGYFGSVAAIGQREGYFGDVTVSAIMESSTGNVTITGLEEA